MTELQIFAGIENKGTIEWEKLCTEIAENHISDFRAVLREALEVNLKDATACNALLLSIQGPGLSIKAKADECEVSKKQVQEAIQEIKDSYMAIIQECFPPEKRQKEPDRMAIVNKLFNMHIKCFARIHALIPKLKEINAEADSTVILDNEDAIADFLTKETKKHGTRKGTPIQPVIENKPGVPTEQIGQPDPTATPTTDAATKIIKRTIDRDAK